MIFCRAAILAILASTAAAAASSTSEDTTSAATRKLMKSKQVKGDPQDEKKKLRSDSAGMQRFLSQARATLMNVEDVQSLSPKEYIFLEDTMREMYEAVYGVSVNNLIVTSAEKSDLDPATNNSKKKKYSGLRGSKNRNSNDGNRDLVWNSVGGFSWFDFSAFFEVTCTLCLPEDDDDDDFYFGGDRKLSSSDSDDDIDFEELRREKLNSKLCEALRAGPFESFWNVQGCQIILG